MFLIIRNDDKQKQFKMYDYWNKQQQTIKHFAGIKLNWRKQLWSHTLLS